MEMSNSVSGDIKSPKNMKILTKTNTMLPISNKRNLTEVEKQ